MGLRLLAQSADDVPALSALAQDAAVRLSEMHFDAKARRFVLLMARYGWEDTSATRCRAALRFEHVHAVQRRGFTALPADTMLNLLSLTVEADALLLCFAANLDIRLQVETIDIILEDFGDPWPALRQPKH